MIGIGVGKSFGLYVEDHSLPLLLTFCVTLIKSPTNLLPCSSCFACVVYPFLPFLFMSYLFTMLAPQGEAESCCVTVCCLREWEP